MAGYKRERDYVREKYGIKGETCHVADVKAALGLTRGIAPNRKDPVKKACPRHLWPLAEEATRAKPDAIRR